MTETWKQWDRGWGWTCKLATGISMSVSKSMIRGEGFSWSVLGLHSKRRYETHEEAMHSVENFTVAVLKTALECFEDMKAAQAGEEG